MYEFNKHTFEKMNRKIDQKISIIFFSIIEFDGNIKNISLSFDNEEDMEILLKELENRNEIKNINIFKNNNFSTIKEENKERIAESINFRKSLQGIETQTKKDSSISESVDFRKSFQNIETQTKKDSSEYLDPNDIHIKADIIYECFRCKGKILMVDKIDIDAVCECGWKLFE